MEDEGPRMTYGGCTVDRRIYLTLANVGPFQLSVRDDWCPLFAPHMSSFAAMTTECLSREI